MAMICCAGCATHTHRLTGSVRPPVRPQDVRLYLEPLQTAYAEIARVEASSRFSWALNVDSKIDVVIRRLQEEAAALGANGIILQEVTASDDGDGDGEGAGVGVGVASDVTRDHASFGVAFFGPGSARVGRGTAIYVAPP